MIDVEISPWTAGDRQAVIDMIVSIQRDEFELPISAADQLDLSDVDGAYRATGGEFFVGRSGCDVVGTIAAIAIEDNTVALRTMFVHRDHRGTTVAARLMTTLVEWSRRAGFRTILLGTADRMVAAHRFFENHDFRRLDPIDLPDEFPHRAVDSIFFRRDVEGAVSMRNHDPRWAERFEEQRRRIADALPHLQITIEHVGSTSVPGLPAKPIVDVVLTVPDAADEGGYFPELTTAGFSFEVREPDWFEHRLFSRDWPRVNLHVFSTGCDEVGRMIRFRDHLRRDHTDRDLYAAVKRDLATREWRIVQDYADAKSDIVAAITSRVR